MADDRKKEDILLGDCLELMKSIPDNSIDMILCDLPYGTTSCKWDIVIPFDKLWEQYKRIIKMNRAIVLFGDEPFSSFLRTSNTEWYKYDWYWRKSRPAGFTNAKLKPLKDIETISIFSNGTTANRSSKNMFYCPQGLEDCDINWSRPKIYLDGDKGINPARKSHKLNRKIEKKGYPRQILDFSNSNNKPLHPTQKPIDLLEYLIKTYTIEQELVLDNCAGSGSTLIAAKKLNRQFIGMEKEEKYYRICLERLNSTILT